MRVLKRFATLVKRERRKVLPILCLWSAIKTNETYSGYSKLQQAEDDWSPTWQSVKATTVQELMSYWRCNLGVMCRALPGVE